MSRKRLYEKKYELKAESIDEISEAIGDTLKSYPELSKKDILRLRLSAEDILLNWLEDTAEMPIELIIDENGRNLDLTLNLSSEFYRKNPLDSKETEENASLDNLTAALGMNWLYQYDQGQNTVYISVEKKHKNQIIVTGTAVILAFLTVLILHIIPEEIADFLQEYILDIIYNYASTFLMALVSPMMFFAVIGGVISVGSPRYLQQNGKLMCRRFLLHILGINLLAGLICARIFPFRLTFKLDKGESRFLSFLSEVIPQDILSPFIECNMIQIIFMGIVIGVAMLFLQRQVKTLNHIVREVNVLICKIINGFETVILLFLYLGMVNVGMSLDLSKIKSLGKMILVFILFTVIIVLVELFVTAKRLELSCGEIWEKLKATAVAQICSASSSVAFSDAYEACENGFKVDKKFVEFALPIGTVMHKPFIAAEFLFMIAALMSMNGQSLDISNMLLLLVVTVVVSIAYPPVSGGELICYTILLAQMELPGQVLAIACSLSSLLDFLEAPANTLSTQLQLLIAAKKVGKM